MIMFSQNSAALVDTLMRQGVTLERLEVQWFTYSDHSISRCRKKYVWQVYMKESRLTGSSDVYYCMSSLSLVYTRLYIHAFYPSRDISASLLSQPIWPYLAIPQHHIHFGYIYSSPQHNIVYSRIRSGEYFLQQGGAERVFV